MFARVSDAVSASGPSNPSHGSARQSPLLRAATPSRNGVWEDSSRPTPSQHKHSWRPEPCGDDWDIVNEQVLAVETIWGISQPGLDTANAVRAAKTPPQPPIVRPEHAHKELAARKDLPFSSRRTARSPSSSMEQRASTRPCRVTLTPPGTTSQSPILTPPTMERPGFLFASKFAPWMTVALQQRPGWECEGNMAPGGGGSPRVLTKSLDRPTPCLASRRWEKAPPSSPHAVNFRSVRMSTPLTHVPPRSRTPKRE